MLLYINLSSISSASSIFLPNQYLKQKLYCSSDIKKNKSKDNKYEIFIKMSSKRTAVTGKPPSDHFTRDGQSTPVFSRILYRTALTSMFCYCECSYSPTSP